MKIISCHNFFSSSSHSAFRAVSSFLLYLSLPLANKYHNKMLVFAIQLDFWSIFLVGVSHQSEGNYFPLVSLFFSECHEYNETSSRRLTYCCFRFVVTGAVAFGIVICSAYFFLWIKKNMKILVVSVGNYKTYPNIKVL